MTNTEPNPIELVRERLDGGRKWHKGSICDYDTGNVCVVGAVRELFEHEEGAPIEHLVGDVALEQYRERISSEVLLDPHRTGVPDFNDHPDTTWADVERVLDKASVAWDEQVR